MLTHLLQRIGVSRAGVQDVDPERNSRQQVLVIVDPVYGEQHGLQPLDPSGLVDAAALLHPGTLLVHGEQTAEHQVPLDADLPAGLWRVSDRDQDALAHHQQEQTGNTDRHRGVESLVDPGGATDRGEGRRGAEGEGQGRGFEGQADGARRWAWFKLWPRTLRTVRGP